MSEMAAARSIVDQAASAVLGRRKAWIVAEAGADSVGDEALKIMVVLARGGEPVSGEELVDVIWKMYSGLQRAGDDRFPIVSFASEEELEDDDTAEG